jgi:hypothetical protein
MRVSLMNKMPKTTTSVKPILYARNFTHINLFNVYNNPVGSKVATSRCYG